MKVRKGFVSNSSTSSYICDVCGEELTGRDLCLSEAEMSECQGNHVFCDSHVEYNIEDYITREYLIKELESSKYESDKELMEKLKGMSDSEYKENFDELSEDEEYISELIRYEVPSIACPVCQLKVLCIPEEVAYLAKTSGISKTEVFEAIHEKNKRRKKLHDDEYIEHVNKAKGVTSKDTLKEVQGKFPSNEDFFKFING